MCHMMNDITPGGGASFASFVSVFSGYLTDTDLFLHVWGVSRMSPGSVEHMYYIVCIVFYST